MTDWIMRLTPVVILLILVVIFVRRKFYREFPFFLAYISFALVATGLRVSVRNMLLAYFWVYWVTDAVLGLLALLSMNEVFRRMFELDYEERGWFRFVLPAAAVGVGCFFLAQPVRPSPTARVTNAIFSFDLGVHCLQGVILLLFLLFEKILTAACDQYEYGIITGFGISASVTAVADLLRSHHGSSYEIFFRYAPPIGYIAATLIWLHAFVRKPPAKQKLPITIQELLRLMAKQHELLEKISRSLKIWRFQGR